MFKLPDIETLRLCSAVTTISFSMVFAILWWTRRNELGLLHWSAGALLYGIALIGFDSSTPGTVTINIVLVGVLALTNIFYLSGIRDFEGQAPFSRWMIAPIAVAVLGYGLPGLLPHSHDPMRAMLVRTSEAMGLAISCATIGCAILFGGTRPRSLGRMIAGVALLAYVPGYVIALAIDVGGHGPGNLLALIPMLSDQMLLGVLNLGLLSMPGERARAQLREAALRDPLTGALNRAGLSAVQESLLSEGVSVVAIDIDHFKSINDRHGHAAGDDALVILSERAGALARRLGGAFARVGGDEFIAILPVGGDAAQLYAERLRTLGQDHPLGGTIWTLSIGIAQVAAGDASFHDARRRADLQLYRAKAQGRNVVAA